MLLLLLLLLLLLRLLLPLSLCSCDTCGGRRWSGLPKLILAADAVLSAAAACLHAAQHAAVPGLVPGHRPHARRAADDSAGDRRRRLHRRARCAHDPEARPRWGLHVPVVSSCNVLAIHAATAHIVTHFSGMSGLGSVEAGLPAQLSGRFVCLQTRHDEC